MLVNVDIAGDTAYKARRGIVIYSSGDGSPYGGATAAYAITAPVVSEGAEGLQFGAWEPVSLEFVQKLGDQLGVRLPAEVLPPQVLTRTMDVVVWWSAPQVRTQFYRTAETGPLKGLRALDGEDLPTPALVWKLDLKQGRLYLRALAEANRPDARSPLYFAPFCNVQQDGLVCQGTMKRPGTIALDTLHEWEGGFFGAAFTSQLHAKLTTHQHDLVGLWPALRRRKRFPAHYLRAADQTLATFVGAK